jgi:hypothetical protein
LRFLFTVERGQPTRTWPTAGRFRASDGVKKRSRLRRLTAQQLRNCLAAISAAACVFLLVSPGGRAAGSGRVGAVCSDETVTVLELKPVPVTLRFVVRGISCQRAHSLIRTYFRHEAKPGYCDGKGVICAYDPLGGWVCSLPGFVGEGGGDFAGCIREHPSARVQVFATAPRTRRRGGGWPQRVPFPVYQPLSTVSARLRSAGSPMIISYARSDSPRLQTRSGFNETTDRHGGYHTGAAGAGGGPG